MWCLKRMLSNWGRRVCDQTAHSVGRVWGGGWLVGGKTRWCIFRKGLTWKYLCVSSVFSKQRASPHGESWRNAWGQTRGVEPFISWCLEGSRRLKEDGHSPVIPRWCWLEYVLRVENESSEKQSVGGLRGTVFSPSSRQAAMAGTVAPGPRIAQRRQPWLPSQSQLDFALNS